MLDKTNTFILKILNELVDTTAFTVVEFSDVIKKLESNKVSMDVEGLITNLEYLKSQNYINTKNVNNKEILVMMLPKSRAFEEMSKAEIKENNKYYELFFWFGLICASAAFLGGFLAYLIFR